ncbi:hypothetical protein [Streptosporangium sp. NBC_01469]|uniref:hypothetical protein n=1 Tax=Streptosporangium sp. NBC_01469 TaxID=2903898 RepID=UPI002E284DAB|nr:hypothetical protein [Streptosporangium sp. NBC_01469]
MEIKSLNIVSIINRRVGREITSTAKEYSGLVSAYSEAFYGTVDDSLSKLDRLSYLDSDTIEKIKPTIADAARCYHARNPFPVLRQAAKRRVRVKVTFPLVIIGAWCWTIQGILPPAPTTSEAIGGVLYAIIPVQIAYFLAKFRYKNVFIVQLVGTLLVILASWRFHFISSETRAEWNAQVFTPPALLKFLIPAWNPEPVKISAYQIAYAPIWGLSATLVFLAIVMVATRWQLALFHEAEPGPWHPKAAYMSSVLIVGMLDLASRLEDSLNREAGHADSLLHGRHYWFSRELARLARVSSGPWARLMRARYGSAGYNAASHASGMAFTFQSWRLKITFMSNQFHDVNREMQLALVAAAEGDWASVVADNAADANLTQGRLVRVLRKTVSIAVPLVVAFMVWAYLGSALTPFSQPIIITCIAFSALQLFLVLDPQAVERLEGVQKITELFKKN